MMRRRPPPFRFALMAVLAVWAGPALAQPLEQAVKAAFLSKFARYVTWPPNARPAPGAPILICLIGRDPFGKFIDEAVAGQKVDDHPLAVRRIASAAQADGCGIAYVRGGSSASTEAMLADLRGHPVLTVTDSEGGSARGMIHFVLNNGRVRFYIDDAAAARSNLALNARLLGVALAVRQRPQ